MIVTDTFPLEDGDDFMQNTGSCSEYPYLGKNYGGSDVYVPHVAEGINDAAHNEYACLSSTDNEGIDIVDENFSMIHGIALNAYDVSGSGRLGPIFSFTGTRPRWVC